jgi:hypothetical protein
MIAQGAMAFNSQRSPTASPYSVPQILVTLKRIPLAITNQDVL